MIPVDFDVLVIGGGPAGIAAAMRARWVKRYSVVPCDVAILDPVPLGGLTQMGTCIMTSPGWIYNEESIRPFLVDDVERFDVPHVKARVTAIERRHDRFEVTSSTGETLSARCVVVCSGMKMLVREPEFWNRGVTATSMGVEWVAGKLRHWLSDPKHRRVVFAGSDKLTNLMPLARSCRAPHVDVHFVLEPIRGTNTATHDDPDVTFGTVVEMSGQERLRSITIEQAETGERKTIDDVDLFVIDFMSYEVRPARSFLCASAALDEQGFIQVDRRQHTDVEGLFAAGDVTGMPACAGTAIGEGIVAGFEAYRYVYRQKFGAEPPLFAYYGYDAPLQEGFQELPPLHATLGPRLLGPSEDVLSKVRERSSADQCEALERTVLAVAQGGRRVASVDHLAKTAELDPEAVALAVRRLLEMKLITLTEVTS